MCTYEKSKHVERNKNQTTRSNQKIFDDNGVTVVDNGVEANPLLYVSITDYYCRRTKQELNAI